MDADERRHRPLWDIRVRRSYIQCPTILRFDISDEKAKALKEAAERPGIPIEELLLASVDDALQRFDTDFEGADDYVLKKNAELSRRLA